MLVTLIEVAQSEFDTEQLYNEDLYQRFHKYYTTVFPTEKLTAEEVRYVEHQARAYRRNGLTLSKEQKDRSKELSKEISTLVAEYESTLNEWTHEFKFTKVIYQRENRV